MIWMIWPPNHPSFPHLFAKAPSGQHWFPWQLPPLGQLTAAPTEQAPSAGAGAAWPKRLEALGEIRHGKNGCFLLGGGGFENTYIYIYIYIEKSCIGVMMFHMALICIAMVVFWWTRERERERERVERERESGIMALIWSIHHYSIIQSLSRTMMVVYPEICLDLESCNVSLCGCVWKSIPLIMGISYRWWLTCAFRSHMFRQTYFTGRTDWNWGGRWWKILILEKFASEKDGLLIDH